MRLWRPPHPDMHRPYTRTGMGTHKHADRKPACRLTLGNEAAAAAEASGGSTTEPSGGSSTGSSATAGTTAAWAARGMADAEAAVNRRSAGRRWDSGITAKETTGADSEGASGWLGGGEDVLVHDGRVGVQRISCGEALRRLKVGRVAQEVVVGRLIAIRGEEDLRGATDWSGIVW